MKILSVIALTIIICSCGTNSTNEQNETEEIKMISLYSGADSIITNISDIGLDVNYIPLQKTHSSQIKVIDKIITHGSKIYISTVNSLLCFDNDGQYLFKLTINWNANEEPFDVIYDFDISSGDTSLIILSSGKILQYKIEERGFRFINHIPIGQLSPSKLDFIPGTENILISFIRVYGNEASLISLINKNGDTIYTKPNFIKLRNPVRSGLSNEIIHYKYESNLCFKEKFNDTIFSISSDSNNFSPRYIINTKLSGKTSQDINNQNYPTISPNVTGVFEVSRYLYFAYNYSDVSSSIYFDKNSNRKLKLDSKNGGLNDDIGGGPGFTPKTCNGHKYISWFSPYELKKYIESKDFKDVIVKNPKKKEDLKILVNSLQDTDNPVLVFVTPKKRIINLYEIPLL